MSESKHTPGPWKVSDVRTDREIRVVVTDPSTQRCSVAAVASYAPMHDMDNADTREDWANAALIAAAPTMHDEGARLLAVLDDGRYLRGDRCPGCGADSDDHGERCPVEAFRAAIAKAGGR